MLAEQSIVKYIRLSMEDAKTDSLSIENQRLLLDRHILESDLDSAHVLEFVDNGYSGVNFERPAVQELLELVRDGKVSCIIVKDFSRFGRNAIETGYFIERVFPMYRVRFISIDDDFDSFALDGDTGGMEVAFKFLINEYYSRDLSIKIRSAKREKALRGEFVTKNCAFGYMLDDSRNMVIDTEAAQTVRLIFEMYAAKKSLVGIAKCLCEEKRHTPAARKKQKRAAAMDAELSYVWQKPVLLQILRDEQYLGMYVAGKTRTGEIGNPNRVQVASEDWIRIPDHHPHIISQALFDAVQEQLRVKGEPLRKRELNTTKRYAASTASPLKGKVICGHCGHNMRISCTKNAAFHCQFTLPAPDAECHRLRVPKEELEKVVLESIKRQAKMIMESDCLAGDIQSSKIPAITEHEGMIERLQDEKQRLYESLVLGDICQEEYRTKKSAVDAEFDRVRNVLEIILSQQHKQVSDMVSINAARVALRKRILSQELADMLIDKVLVYPDNRIEIVWKLAGFINCTPKTSERYVAI